MSTIGFVVKMCKICGKESEHKVIRSTNCFGSSDLDTRPPEMKRSTMHLWLMKCPYCNYVAEDIEHVSFKKDSDGNIVENHLENVQRINKLIHSKQYLQCDSIKFCNKLAKDFYRQYLIGKSNENTRQCMFALLHCSWACDDVKDQDNANQIRLLLVEYIVKLLETEDVENMKESLVIVLLDAYRRTGCFDEMKVYAERVKDELTDDLIKQLFSYELLLAEKKDVDCHTVSDAYNTLGVFM